MILELLKLLPESDLRKKEFYLRGCELVSDASMKNSDICVQFALEAFQRKNFELPRTLAKRVVDNQLEKSEKVSEMREVQWLAIAECLLGNLLELSLLETQSQSHQNQLREQAINYYVSAAEVILVSLPSHSLACIECF